MTGTINSAWRHYAETMFGDDEREYADILAEKDAWLCGVWAGFKLLMANREDYESLMTELGIEGDLVTAQRDSEDET